MRVGKSMLDSRPEFSPLNFSNSADLQIKSQKTATTVVSVLPMLISMMER
jgi:hypothetical protein